MLIRSKLYLEIIFFLIIFFLLYICKVFIHWLFTQCLLWVKCCSKHQGTFYKGLFNMFNTY